MLTQFLGFAVGNQMRTTNSELDRPSVRGGAFSRLPLSAGVEPRRVGHGATAVGETGCN